MCSENNRHAIFIFVDCKERQTYGRDSKTENKCFHMDIYIYRTKGIVFKLFTAAISDQKVFILFIRAMGKMSYDWLVKVKERKGNIKVLLFLNFKIENVLNLSFFSSINLFSKYLLFPTDFVFNFDILTLFLISIYWHCFLNFDILTLFLI